MSELAACTIITKNYLPYARTLANSLAKYNPNITLYVLLADRVDDYFDPSLENFKFIYLEDLSESQAIIEQMCFYYTPMELCCALRGLLHDYMFEQTNIHSWIFLDSDMMVFGSLNMIFEQLAKASILLTPHSVKPLDNECVDPCEINFLRSGLYNAGFLGLRRTDTSRKFVSWLKDRLRTFSFHDYANKDFVNRGLFADQLWLNLVPLYFSEVELCLHPGANLGHWNIFDRTFDKDDDGTITVNREPVLFIHFSGWDINNIDRVSKYGSSVQTAPLFWVELSNPYRDSLLSNGYESFKNYPYAFNCFQNSEVITPEMRHKYYSYVLGSNNIESPFSNQLYERLISEIVTTSSKANILTRVAKAFKRRIKKLVKQI
jgi:hypothetical protein